jgi:hypothetical protein
MLLNVLLSGGMLIRFWHIPIEGCPNRLPNKQPHGMDQFLMITSESMIDTFRQSHEVPLFHMDTDPVIIQVTNIKISRATQDKSNFFGVMNVLFKK